MMSPDGLLGFANASGLSAVTYDVTYFPHADDAEVAYQLRQLARDLETVSYTHLGRDSRRSHRASTRPASRCPFVPHSPHRVDGLGARRLQFRRCV